MPDFSASVIRLDLGEGRNEHSVILMGENLNDLTPLLCNPCTYLHVLPDMWPKGPDARIPWSLMQPTNVVLEAAFSSAENIAKFKAFFGIDLPKAQSEAMGKMLAASAGVLGATVTPAAVERLKTSFQRALPNGGFIVEFAIDTHTILVRYFRPAEKTERRFKTKITPQTLVKVTDEVAYLHFDIGGSTADRADFIHDYMRDRAGLVNELIAQGAGFHMANTPPTKPDRALIPGVLTQTDPPEFRESPLPPRIVIEQITSSLPDTRGPERFRDPEPPPVPECICVDLSVIIMQTGSEPAYYLDSALVKHYFAPCPT